MQKSKTRGIHHLALNAEDMRATMDFYVDVVGMPLVHAMKVPPGLGTGPGNRGNPPYEEQAFTALQKRLQAAGIAYDGPVGILPGLESIYFPDPNGIRLEACCEPAAGDKPGVVGSVAQTRAELMRELETLAGKIPTKNGERR